MPLKIRHLAYQLSTASYEIEYGVSRFEIFTLVAMVVYSLVAYGIVQLFNIGRRS